MQRQFIIDLIDLRDFQLIRITYRSEGWTAILDPAPRCYLCPLCGGASTAHKRNQRRQLRHRVVPHFGFIHVEVPVYHQQCTTCMHIWSVQWEGIPPYGNVTFLFREAVLSMCEEASLSSVARKQDIPYTTLERWYYKWANEQIEMFHQQRVSPEVICLDDFATRKGHQYAVTLMDEQTGEVCQMGQGRSRAAIQRNLHQWPYAPPKVVVTDLAPGMAKTVQEVWPTAKIAADPFHVIQLFTKALERSLKKNGKKNHTQRKRRSRLRLLTTNPIHFTFRELLFLEQLLAEIPVLMELYQALQGIRRLYQQLDKPALERTFAAWRQRYLFSEHSEVHRIAKTILQWKEPILNAIHFQVSNGKIEGVNNKIKMIKRRAYGYRNMEHLSVRVQLETASVHSG